MKPISLISSASYLPERVVCNDFFGLGSGESSHLMFRGVTRRRHLGRDETASGMIASPIIEAMHALIAGACEYVLVWRALHRPAPRPAQPAHSTLPKRGSLRLRKSTGTGFA